MATLDITPLYVPGDKEFWIEVMNDDRTHGLIVARFDRFDPALAFYENLIKDAQLRVVFRQRMHVWRNHIPARLHNSYDLRREYPI